METTSKSLEPESGCSMEFPLNSNTPRLWDGTTLTNGILIGFLNRLDTVMTNNANSFLPDNTNAGALLTIRANSQQALNAVSAQFSGITIATTIRPGGKVALCYLVNNDVPLNNQDSTELTTIRNGINGIDY